MKNTVYAGEGYNGDFDTSMFEANRIIEPKAEGTPKPSLANFRMDKGFLGIFRSGERFGSFAHNRTA